MERESPAAHAAKEFIVSEVVKQAHHDKVQLSPVEQRLLLWSEVYNTGIDDETIAANDEPGEMEKFEKKIAFLLKRARQSASDDKHRDQKWKDSLRAIEDQDHYIWVMLDQAGIKK